MSNPGQSGVDAAADAKRKADAAKKDQDDFDEHLKKKAREKWVRDATANVDDSWYKLGELAKPSQGAARLLSGDDDEPLTDGIYHRPGSSMDIKVKIDKDGTIHATPVIPKPSSFAQHCFTNIWILAVFKRLYDRTIGYARTQREIMEFLIVRGKCTTITPKFLEGQHHVGKNAGERGSFATDSRMKILRDIASDYPGVTLTFNTDDLTGPLVSRAARRSALEHGKYKDAAGNLRNSAVDSRAQEMTDALKLKPDLGKSDAAKRLGAGDAAVQEDEFKTRVLQKDGKDLTDDKEKIAALDKQLNDLKARRAAVNKDIDIVDAKLTEINNLLANTSDPVQIGVLKDALAFIGKAKNALRLEAEDITAQENLVKKFADAIPVAPASTVTASTAAAPPAPNPELDALNKRIKDEVTDARPAAVTAGKDAKTRLDKIDKDISGMQSRAKVALQAAGSAASYRPRM